MIELTILVISGILNLLLGLTVFSKNQRAVTNRLFLMLTISLVVWSTANYESVHPQILSQLTWIRLVLFCGAFLNLAVFLTFLAFPNTNFSASAKKKVRAIGLLTLAVMVLTLTPLVFKELRQTSSGVQPVPAPGIGIFLIQTVGLLGASFVILLKKFRAAKGALKNQLRLILFGIGTTFGLILLNNLLLVVIFNVTVFVPLGPAFTLIFTGAFAYAIIRHHLFDVRKFAARSMAYILSIGTMAAIYSAVIFGASYIFIKDNDSIADSRLFGTFIALLLAFSFQAIKKFFDRLSDSIFYKDVYDPQKFLDEFNQILVERVELDPLLEGSTSVIVENLKADFCTFVIRETAYFPIRTIGTNMPNFNDDEIVSIRSMVPHIRTKVIVTDLLNEADQELKDSLLKKNIAVVVRLVPTLDFEIEGIGEIMLGAKRNGEAYTVQDIQILEILGNELVIAIQNALRFEEIDKFNITLQNKIDVATKQLKRTNEKLQALDETKDEFISMASHQLRTPLTSVKGYLSMVLEGDAGELNEMQKKLLNQAFTSSQRMVYLIADLLNVSRLKTGKFIIERHPTNLAEVVEGEIAQLIETAKARDLELTFKKPESFTAIMLDEVKIRQVIMNFTDNAIYYTPAGGHIKVGLKETKDSIEFTVTDDGMGVPKSEQPHLFTKFYRAGNARKARPDGTGLGLFMAKKVIVAQGGALVFKSQEGKGSTFGFSFSKSKMKVPEITPTVAK